METEVLFNEIRDLRDNKDISSLLLTDTGNLPRRNIMDPNTRTLCIKVFNKSFRHREVVLFDALDDCVGIFRHIKINKRVNISLFESNYEAFRKDLLSSVFIAGGLKIMTSHRDQLFNDIFIYRYATTGEYEKIRISPNYYKVPDAPIQTIVEIPGRAFILDKHTCWNFSLLPRGWVTFIFSLIAKFESGGIKKINFSMPDIFNKNLRDPGLPIIIT